MSDLMDGGHCVPVKGKTWQGIACGVKGSLSHEDYLEMEKFAKFLKQWRDFRKAQAKGNEGIEP